MPDTHRPPSSPESSAPSAPNSPRSWAEPGIGRSWQHRFFYWLIRIGGKSRGYHMAYIVTFWYVLFYPSIRTRCRFYLDRRFPDRRSGLRRFLNIYRLVRTYGATLVDGLIFDLFGPAAFNVSSPDHDKLLQLSTGGRGLILIHAHVGCWRIGMSTLSKFPTRVSVVQIPDPKFASRADSFVAEILDPRKGLEAAMQMTDALLKCEIVAMAGDRTLGSDQSVVPATFLGGQAMLPIAPYRLASATGSPVLVVTAPKIEGNRYELRLANVIEVPPGLGRNPQAYAPYAQMFADSIEAFLRDFPWQYYNFYDLWHNADKAN
jgi:predicted LPLAT superfamily acyltransferase